MKNEAISEKENNSFSKSFIIFSIFWLFLFIYFNSVISHAAGPSESIEIIKNVQYVKIKPIDDSNISFLSKTGFNYHPVNMFHLKKDFLLNLSHINNSSIFQGALMNSDIITGMIPERTFRYGANTSSLHWALAYNYVSNDFIIQKFGYKAYLGTTVLICGNPLIPFIQSGTGVYLNNSFYLSYGEIYNHMIINDPDFLANYQRVLENILNSEKTNFELVIDSINQDKEKQ